MTFTTRFAPSPTGPLHLGHAYSALLAQEAARAANGRFLLRIDDLDQSRARAQWEDRIFEDMSWLGITWDARIYRQSEHFADYAKALGQLEHQGLTYRCACSRRDIAEAAGAPQEGAPAYGPDGRIYPGTCRKAQIPADAATCIRLDMRKAARRALPAGFAETGPAHTGRQDLALPDLIQSIGDPVLARRDRTAAYHLAVVIDDAATGITNMIRGADLFEATRIHVVLQKLLGLPIPIYHHHRLIRDENGKRLAKRDDARAIAKFRADGLTPAQIRKNLGL